MWERLLPLKQLMKTDYKREEVKKGIFICSQCDKYFYHVTKLVAHCQYDHHLKICMKIIIIMPRWAEPRGIR